MGVKEIKKDEVILNDGEVVPCGIVVWSTGIQPIKFIKNLEEDQKNFKLWKGRLMMDQ